MKIEPIIVTGVGRSGTSVIAGILHHLGVYMGEEFIPANKSNLTGYWEDKEFIKLNAHLLEYQITIELWYKKISELVSKRQALGEKWGFKDPSITNLLNFYVQLFPNALYINCTRDKDEIIESLQRTYNWGIEQCLYFYDLRQVRLKHIIPKNLLTVDLKETQGNSKKILDKIIKYCKIEATDEQKLNALNLVRRR